MRGNTMTNNVDKQVIEASYDGRKKSIGYANF